MTDAATVADKGGFERAKRKAIAIVKASISRHMTAAGYYVSDGKICIAPLPMMDVHKLSAISDHVCKWNALSALLSELERIKDE